MKKKYIWIILFFIIAVTPALGKSYLRRFALIVGANNGGRSRVRLRYAYSDAKSVARVMKQLGGIVKTDIRLLNQPNIKSLVYELMLMYNKIRTAKKKYKQVELLFYYSGHSDEQGILLAGSKITYKRLKHLITSINADVRIVVLDSCSSGALVRLKGGKMKAPFLYDSSMKMRGSVFLTSSSHNEASQESDKIRGSFFTHYLVSGLRGGADMSQDGRVTLNEAYQFAYHQTLARTEKTIGGPQHAGYAIHMKGSGDVVLTDIRKSSSILIFNKNVSGRVSIRNQEGVFVAELNKNIGIPMTIGLMPGSYKIILEKNRKRFQSKVSLWKGRIAHIYRKHFRYSSVKKDGRRKGLGKRNKKYKKAVFAFSIFGSIATHSTDVESNFMMNLFSSSIARLKGFGFGGVNIVHDGMKGFITAYIGNIISGEVKGALITSLFNNVYGEFDGIQIAGLYNYSEGDFKGAQVSGLFNYLDGSAKGVYVGGLFNYFEHKTKGLAISGLFNFGIQKFKGMQVAGILNHNRDDFHGMQFALVNIGGHIKGTQIGLVNIARKVDGAQIGLVNISDETDAPIGLFNFSKNGQFHLQLWYNELGMFNIGVKFGSRNLYAMFYNGLRGWNDIGSFGYGFGGHINLGEKYFLNIEFMNQFFFTTDGTIKMMMQNNRWEELFKLRASIGMKLNSYLTLQAGVSLNMLYPKESSVHPQAIKELTSGDMRLWPGFFIGVQLL